MQNQSNMYWIFSRADSEEYQFLNTNHVEHMIASIVSENSAAPN